VCFSYPQKINYLLVIFLALWLKVICKTRLALYFGVAKVILNKSTTRRKAISLVVRQISQIRLRIYLVAESLAGTRLSVVIFCLIAI